MGNKNHSVIDRALYCSIVLLCSLLVLLPAKQACGQERIFTQWEDIAGLSQAELLEELPIALVGQIIFFRNDQPFFVMQTGANMVPVFFKRSLSNLQTGDFVKVTGTTTYSFDRPGIRLTYLEPTDPLIESIDMVDSKELTLSDQSYFSYTSKDGFVSDFEEIEDGFLLDFVIDPEKNICLFVHSKQVDLDGIHTYIGKQVQVSGVFLPFKADLKGEKMLPTICMNASSKLVPIHDFLVQNPVSYQNLGEFVKLGETPIVMDGTLERRERSWFLKHQDMLIGLDWENNNDQLIGKSVRCIGYASKSADNVSLLHTVVFQPLKPLNSAEIESTSLQREDYVWRKSIPPSENILRSIKEVRDSDALAGDTPIGVDLQATVTYHDPNREVLFVEDDDDGIYVHVIDKVISRIAAGSLVRIRGVKERGITSSLIVLADAQVIAESTKREPKICDISELMTGEMDCNFVAIEARVELVQRIDHTLEIKLLSNEGAIKAIIPFYPEKESYDFLIDSKVMLTGTCGFDFNSNNEVVGIILYMNDYDQLTIIEPSRSSFDQEPITQLTAEQLAAQSQVDSSRVLLNGQFLGWTNTGGFYFQTTAQGFIVNPIDANLAFNFGQSIQILGWPRLHDNTFEIVDALVKVSDQNSQLPFQSQSSNELSKGNLNRLIRRAGILTQQKKDEESLTFQIDSSGQLLTAIMNWDNAIDDDITEIRLDSTVEIEGILVSAPGDGSMGELPVIRVTGPEFVRQLSPPSFLTPQKVFWLLSAAGVVGLVAVLWGVTLKKQVSHQTAEIRKTIELERQAKKRFQRIFESALDMIFLCDTSARVISMNQAGLELLGIELSEIKGKSILKWIAPGDRGKAEEALGLGSKEGRALATEGEVIELQFKTNSGQLVYVELSLRGYILNRGGFGYQCIARNVDARKQSEAHLVKARDAYREANQAKSAFLAMMSHELRTPMNGVIGMTQLLLKSSLDNEQKDQAETILASSRGMMRLILDLLDISRIESDRLILNKESFDLVNLVEEVLGTLSVEADRKKLDLTLEVQPRMIRQYHGDATRLRQVLLNLIGNGIKFTEHGGVAVKIKNGNLASEENQVRIEVEDTGIGIGDVEKKDLFEAFVQLDSSATRKYGGAGLGLTICKRIVLAMGGLIGVEGQSKRGSSFWVEIPLKVIDQRSVLRVPPLRIPSEASVVLLVTNSSVVRSYFRNHFEPTNSEVKVESTTSFVERTRNQNEGFTNETFFAVIIDVSRPGKSFQDAISVLANESVSNGVKWISIEPISGQSEHAQVLERIPQRLKILKPLTESTFQLVCQFLSEDGSDSLEAHHEKDVLKVSANNQDPKAIVARAGLKVLVAEDDPINQKLIALYLKKIGSQAVIVPDGKQVLNKLVEQEFDVILMDCSMPVMDGFEASRKIRENVKHTNLHIIALTAHTLKGDRERCFAAGMNDYLPKPLNLDLLTEKLSHLVADQS